MILRSAEFWNHTTSTRPSPLTSPAPETLKPDWSFASIPLMTKPPMPVATSERFTGGRAVAVVLAMPATSAVAAASANRVSPTTRAR